MPAPGGSPFDGNPNSTPPVTGAYRPGSADFNGAALANSQTFPPDPSTMPTAELLNTYSLMLVALGRLCQVATISVIYPSGVPILDSFTAAPTAVTSSTFTIARTGGGAANGDVTITWPAGTFPAQVTQPKAHLNGTTPGGICVSAVTNGIRIVTVSMSNVATDLPFTADLM